MGINCVKSFVITLMCIYNKIDGDILLMLKFPYVMEYKLFEKVDLAYAGELLNEYQDFFEYNKMQVAQVYNASTVDTFENPKEEEEVRAEAERIEHNRSVCIDHFEKHFGSKDFAEASLVGLKIDFYELQKILMSEHRRGILIMESALNTIAPKLRALASSLLYAERIVSGLGKLSEIAKEKSTATSISASITSAAFNNSAAADKAQLAVDFAKDGFNLLLERLLEQEVAVPEYYRSKKELSKLKTIDAYIDFCEKLFFQTEGK